MKSEFQSVFARLRNILEREAAAFSVTEDTHDRYCLSGAVGPATLQAWNGKMKSPTIPVAWVQIGKGYVSFHQMALYGSPRLRDSMSKELLARMQGKTCFNFTAIDEPLFKELEALTANGCRAMRTTGFVQ